MVDMSNYIAAKSDQLNAEDLIAGPRTITITAVRANPGAPDQPVSVSFQGDDGKPWKPCKTTRRVLVRVWGADASKYVGRSLTLYRDPKVKFGGIEVGGIRISHMSHMDGDMTMALMASQKRMQPVTIKPLRAQKVSQQPAMAEEAAGHVPHVDPAEVAAAGSEGFDFDEPEHVLAARSLEAALKAAQYPSDLEVIRRKKAEWSLVKRGDPSLFETLVRVAKLVEARLEGEVE